MKKKHAKIHSRQRIAKSKLLLHASKSMMDWFASLPNAQELGSTRQLLHVCSLLKLIHHDRYEGMID